jgi:cytochrome c553
MRTVTHTRAIVPLIMLAIAGCNDMYDQPRYEPLEESRYFSDRQSSRQPLKGTIARGGPLPDEFRTAGKIGGRFADSFPFPITDHGLRRGQEKFNVFCAPCHGRLGDGLGIIVQRGFPRPNSFHSDTLRSRPVGYYFDVMTRGFGRMYSYASSVPVDDRWRIAAYIRALQLSQHIPIERMMEADRHALQRLHE